MTCVDYWTLEASVPAKTDAARRGQQRKRNRHWLTKNALGATDTGGRRSSMLLPEGMKTSKPLPQSHRLVLRRYQSGPPGTTWRHTLASPIAHPTAHQS